MDYKKIGELNQDILYMEEKKRFIEMDLQMIENGDKPQIKLVVDFGRVKRRSNTTYYPSQSLVVPFLKQVLDETQERIKKLKDERESASR